MLKVLRKNMDSETQGMLEKWQNTLNQLSRLILNKPENMTPASYKSKIQDLENKEETLERQLAAKSSTFQRQTQAITVEAISKKIPPKALLVEFVVYKDHYRNTKYAAVTVNSDGDYQWFPLGSASEIDNLSVQFIQQLSSRQPYEETATKLYQKIIKPLQSKLAGKRHVLISPDGQLNLIPFEALIDQQHLVEQYQLSYLSSGRDLLQYDSSEPYKNPSSIVAFPTYGKATETLESITSIASQGEKSRAIDVYTAAWSKLPGTKSEAKSIRKLLGKKTNVVLEEDATELYIKSLESPKILHIATHGFFLSDIETSDGDTRGQKPIAIQQRVKPTPSTSSAESLVRSGLVLASVYQQRSGKGQDGVLTAKEFASLELMGTRLVTLSACETGVGAVKNGQGVFGLRRSMVLSGAETSLMSLWKVSDEGTKNLMQKYYKRLNKKEGRSDALRSIQLELLQSKRYSHPFYWAAFVVSGDWKPMAE